MILLSQWYTPPDESRLRELLAARKANEESGLFEERVFLDADKKRYAFADFFDLAASQFAGKVCVIANTDIYFDDSLRLLSPHIRPKRVVALTRWDTEARPDMCGWVLGRQFFSGTQDSWVFIGGEVPRPRDDIRVGFMGCDQAVLGCFLESGCEIINPSLDVKSWHLHAEESTHDDDPVIKGPYAYPELTTLVEYEGLVAKHDWPAEDPSLHFRIYKTCRE